MRYGKGPTAKSKIMAFLAAVTLFEKGITAIFGMSTQLVTEQIMV